MMSGGRTRGSRRAEDGVVPLQRCSRRSSGMFTKSSSVTYRVRIEFEQLDLVGALLDAISETKKASLST